MFARKRQHVQRHLHACTNAHRPCRLAYCTPTSHIEGFIHWILCHLRSPVLHSLRSASFGSSGSGSRFIVVMGESHYNVSGVWEQRQMERHYSGSGWRPWVCSIIHSQLLHHATDTELTMSNILFIKVALKNLVVLLSVTDWCAHEVHAVKKNKRKKEKENISTVQL